MREWRCFHCNTVCKNEHEAKVHFGDYREARLPVCFAFGEAWNSALSHTCLAREKMRQGESEVAAEHMWLVEWELMRRQDVNPFRRPNSS